MISIKKHNFRLKEIFCMSALAFVSATALIFTGCSDKKPLSDSELVNVLSEKLGENVEITEQKELEDAETLPLLYSMKSADGTEFTVKRLRMQHGYFGSFYYEYDCDYLLNWVHDHPEVNSAIDERNLIHEDIGSGTKIKVRSFDEVHTAVEAVCALVEDSSNNIPAVSDIDDEYELKFKRPIVMVSFLTGNNNDTCASFSEYNYSDGTVKEDYDKELETFITEWKYVDEVRDGDIDVVLPYEILEKYGPSTLKIKLMNRNYDLMLVRNTDRDIPFDIEENLYYILDYIDIQHSETLDFPWVASFAECTGFEPYAADNKSYTIVREDEKVVFRFSESGCYAERNGVKTDLRGKVDMSKTTCSIKLTTDDLTKLFDTEFKLDLVNETAEITNMKQ